MPNILRTIYSPVGFDVVFAAAGLVGFGGLAVSAGAPVPAIAASGNPVLKGAALVGAYLLGGVIGIFSTRFDQKVADDFLFQTITKSAFVGMMAFVLGAVLWEVALSRTLGGLSSQTMVAAVVASWAFGWFYTRLRGTRA